VMILARINGTAGFGFAEAMKQRDGSVKRVGLLELPPANAADLQSCVESSQPLVYSGPVWVGDAWVQESFPVTLTPVAFVGDVMTSVSIVQSSDVEMSGPMSDNHAAA
jgi:hypothetical protein